LDLNLISKQGQLEIEGLRKPTVTDITINCNSCHAKEQKLAAYKNWIHRLLTLPLKENNKKQKLNTVINIALNNRYRKEDIVHIYNKPKQQQNYLENKAEKGQKWITFTYTGNYILKITKLLKDTNLKIALKTTSTLGKLLNEKQEMNSCKQCGIYKITCQSCHKVYIGQTGRNLTMRYKEQR
jgi:hypothetical protein